MMGGQLIVSINRNINPKGENKMNVLSYLEAMGRKVKDKVSGQEGVVTSVSFDLYGCVQYLLNPGIDKDGNQIQNWWMDEKRIVFLSKEPVMEVPDFSNPPGPPSNKPAFD